MNYKRLKVLIVVFVLIVFSDELLASFAEKINVTQVKSEFSSILKVVIDLVAMIIGVWGGVLSVTKMNTISPQTFPQVIGWGAAYIVALGLSGFLG